MNIQDEKFSVVIPACLEKAGDGEWRVYGLASTSRKDQQGEVMDLKGLDLTPLEKGRGVFNFEHKKGPENTVGIIDSCKKSDEGLYLGGYLFQNHDRAKALHSIMTSLRKSDKGRMGMSVEGVIKQRAGKDGKVIKKAVITSCALTMNPVNEDTYINLVKSFDGGVEVENTSLEDDFNPEKQNDQGPTFTAAQVVQLLQKALAVGAGYATTPPTQLSGGDALAMEDLESKKTKKKGEQKKLPEPKLAEESDDSKEPKLLKKGIADVLEQLQVLYPSSSRTELWEAVKERLHKRFLNEDAN